MESPLEEPPLIDEGARMTGEQTFKPQEACAAIRLPRGTLQTWSARGLLRQFDAASVRAGQTYGFSLADVLALALIKEAVGRGINTPVLFDKAHFYADSFLWFPGRVRECVLRFYGEPGAEGSTAAVGTDQVSEPEPPLPGVRTTVHFDLEAIFGPVLTALAPAEGPDAFGVLLLDWSS